MTCSLPSLNFLTNAASFIFSFSNASGLAIIKRLSVGRFCLNGFGPEKDSLAIFPKTNPIKERGNFSLVMLISKAAEQCASIFVTSILPHLACASGFNWSIRLMMLFAMVGSKRLYMVLICKVNVMKLIIIFVYPGPVLYRKLP